MIQVTFSTEFSLFRLLSLLLVHGSGILFDSNLCLNIFNIYSVIQVLGVDLGLDSFRKMEREEFFLAPFCTTRMYILSSRATDLWL